MPSDMAGLPAPPLLDPTALVIVLAGTMLATAARCGWHDLRAAAIALARLARSDFDEAANRAAMARTLHAIEKAGFRAVEEPPPPDPALATLVESFLRHGSTDLLHSLRRSGRAAREIARMQAVRTFEHAGELAPMFGLVGTLFAITQIAPIAAAGPVETTMGAIATAVLSSLYGVLSAHFVYIPLARAIERQGEREEAAREALVEWLDTHLHSMRIETNHDPTKAAA